jgi:N-acetylmuramoyl-L-alanine amidase
MLEKDLVLDVARLLAERLRKNGLRVSMTRDGDETVPLETRTSLANDTRGDLFVSIHANSHESAIARGVETYFVSLEASDADARRVAYVENQAFAGGKAAAPGDDPLVALLGDMIATEHLEDSQEFARLAQAELAAGSGTPSRGVKQAPFVVLMGVQMPASLVEIGFVSNPREAAALAKLARRREIADALARAVAQFGRRYDARRGVAPAQGGSGRQASGGGR